MNRSDMSPSRYLEPMDRISELLFGFIMALTFTCSFSVAESGREQVRAMVVGALGCNIAWGIIDSVFYIMNRFSVQGRGIVTLRSLRQLPAGAAARQVIADKLPPVLVSVLSSQDFEAMRQKLNKYEIPVRPHLSKNDWLGSVAIFLVVISATLPVIAPFVLFSNARRALRVSNGVAVLMLFATGYAFGQHSGRSPWRMAVAMVLIGSGLVGITILLGG
jgi:hypothetical protein